MAEYLIPDSKSQPSFFIFEIIIFIVYLRFLMSIDITNLKLHLTFLSYELADIDNVKNVLILSRRLYIYVIELY